PSVLYECGSVAGGAPPPEADVPSPKRTCQWTTGTLSAALMWKSTGSGALPCAGLGVIVSAVTPIEGATAQSGSGAPSGVMHWLYASRLAGFVPRSNCE